MTISAVIPIFNRAHCIGRAVESILAQTQPADEILVVDDGSTDDLEGALEPFGNAARLIRHPKRQGAAAARNTGIAQAQGEYIAFLDSDDIWMPEKIHGQMAFMRDLGVEVACTNFELVAPGKETGVAAWRPYGTVLSLSDIVWGCYVSPGSTLIGRKETLSGISGFDPSFQRYEDWDLLLRIVMDGKRDIGFLPHAFSKIYLGRNYSPHQAHGGLDRIVEKHSERLRGKPKLHRQMKSAVAFNRASIKKSEGDYLGSMVEIAKAFCLKPVNNWLILVILSKAIFRNI